VHSNTITNAIVLNNINIKTLKINNSHTTSTKQAYHNCTKAEHYTHTEQVSRDPDHVRL